MTVENRCAELVALLPKAKLYSDEKLEVNFSWGNEYDLTKYLNFNRHVPEKTPLIWLVQSKETEDLNLISVTKKCRFIIADIVRKAIVDENAINTEIWEKHFEKTLIPIKENFVKTLQRSGVTRIIDEKIDIEKEANFGSNQKAEATDLWNVIVLEATLTYDLTNKCINKIYF